MFTTLTGRGMPIIRYRTGDMARFISRPCPCGKVLRRMAPAGRVRGRIFLAGGRFLSMAVAENAATGQASQKDDPGLAQTRRGCGCGNCMKLVPACWPAGRMW